MSINYHSLNALSHTGLKKIMKILGLKSRNHYNSDRSLLSKVPELQDYEGRIKTENIINFLTDQDHPEFIFNIKPGLYKTQQSLSHEERKALYEALPNTGIYKDNHKALSHEERVALTQALPNTGIYKDTVKLSKEERREHFERVQEAHKQLRKALETIKLLRLGKHIEDKTIVFDIEVMNEVNKEYFNEHVGEVILKLMNVIKANEKWFCNYYFDDRVRTKKLYDLSFKDLLHQLENENLITQIELENAITEESNYDFFEVNIKNLKRIEFIELESNKDFEIAHSSKGFKLTKKNNEVKMDAKLEAKLKKDIVYQALLNTGNTAAIEKYVKDKYKVKQYKTRSGNFWKYTLPIALDLERYQIFQYLDIRSVKLMTEDNCLIYACRQAGVDDDRIDKMREIIKDRSFPQAKLKEIAEELNITFKVKIVYLHKASTKDKYITYEPSTKASVQTIQLLLIDEHYCLNESVPVTRYFIQHYKEVMKMNEKTNMNSEYIQKLRYDRATQRYKYCSKASTPIDVVIKLCFECKLFKPITVGSVLSYSSALYKEALPSFTNLQYNADLCTKLKQAPSDSKEKNFKQVYYADFECSTDNVHKAFNICYSSPNHKIKSLWGDDCAKQFLEAIPDHSLIYFHNLSYDINFIVKELNSVIGTPIIKGSRTLMLTGLYKKKTLCFKDSYAVITKPLKMFPVMFNLQTGPKEVFPYNYYTSTLLRNSNRVGVISEACKHVSDTETFMKNINTIANCKLSNDTFDLEVYSSYYCKQDVRILQEGFERFRCDLLEAFNLDVYDYVSISSIANRYFEEKVYWINGNLYDLANKPREFISRCIQGGRCMLNSNEKQINLDTDNPIVDFDKVSLYPAAIARLYTLEGIPKVLDNEMLNTKYLFKHLFTDDQVTPTYTRYISGFFVEAVIEEIGIHRSFPQIVVDPRFNEHLDKNVARSSNTCCTMYLDHIALEDLIKYQKAKVKIVKGYYFDGNRDLKIRDIISNLFQLRLKYKKENNPLQEVIKLILNSVYGKTILKPIENKIKFIPECDASRYIHKNYNAITSMEHLYESDLVMFKSIKPIVRHYNFCTLGVNILSMSKRIMNEVFTTAEDAGIHIFYQDTDSGHFYKKDIPLLQELYNKKYNRELIGKNLDQFHSDFAEIDKGYESVAAKSVFVGKKSYIDMLTNDLGHIAFHCRLKGVKQDVIAITANEMFNSSDYVKVKYDESSGLFVPEGDTYDINSKFTVFQLYLHLYKGYEVEFDLCKSKNPCFEQNDNYTITTKNTFIRKLKF